LSILFSFFFHMSPTSIFPVFIFFTEFHLLNFFFGRGGGILFSNTFIFVVPSGACRLSSWLSCREKFHEAEECQGPSRQGLARAPRSKVTVFAGFLVVV
jgi:hypothetical protein